jgi:hypothetical protein
MALDDSAAAPKLDPVRERFVQEYHATGNATEAYRRAKPHAAKWKESALNPKASRMLAEGKVQARLEELQEQAAKRHGTTIDSLTSELEAARDGAMGTGQFSAAVSATMGKARLHGLIKPNDAPPLVPASAPAPVINVILSSDKPQTSRQRAS